MLTISKTEIANLALGHLASTLSVIDIETDNSNAARVIRRHYSMAINTFLEMHPWSFAKQEIALALSQENPSKMYAYEYYKPADCLVIQQIAPDGVFIDAELYESQKVYFEERNVGSTTRLWCNVPLAWAQYTTRVPDDFAFPAHFARGLSYQMALDIGPSLVTNNWAKIKQTLIPEAENAKTNAIAYDLARQPLKPDSPSPFILARYQC